MICVQREDLHATNKLMLIWIWSTEQFWCSCLCRRLIVIFHRHLTMLIMICFLFFFLPLKRNRTFRMFSIIFNCAGRQRCHTRKTDTLDVDGMYIEKKEFLFTKWTQRRKERENNMRIHTREILIEWRAPFFFSYSLFGRSLISRRLTMLG